MKIKAIQTIIEWDGGAMVILNAGEEGELSDALAQGHIDGGTAEPASKKASKARPAADGGTAEPASEEAPATDAPADEAPAA